MKEKSAFLKNILYAFLAQGIALALSVFMSLIVPKVLNVEQYSYWQLFIFYIGYVGFFHFGLADGVYLRLGGCNYDELDYRELGGELRILFYIQVVLSVSIGIGVVFSDLLFERKYVIVLTIFYMIISNLSIFFGYVFQAVNQTRLYSLSVIWDRIIVIICFGILVYFRVADFYVYVLIYSLSKLSSLIYCIVKGWRIVFAAKASFQTSWKRVKEDILAGINIMIANIAGSLILGVGRMVVDQRWGIESFGKFSFSLSLTNFFLLFITQISMVLFPALRRVSDEKMKEAYVKLRFLVSVLLPCAFLIYVPMKMFLLNWLPAYEESLQYMVLLLPICTYDGKMQLLCNTYLKVLRKEKQLLRKNIMALTVSVALCLMSGYVFNDVTAVAASMVIAIAVRSVMSELYLSKLMGERLFLQIAGEFALVIVFIAAHFCLSDWAAFSVMLFAYLLFLTMTYLKQKLYKNGGKLL